MKGSYDYGLWLAVLVNASLFIFFAFSFLRPRKRREWRSLGVLSAFLVALFTEMYGFPLTIYLLTSFLGSRYPFISPYSHENGNLWAALTGGSPRISELLMLLGGAVMFAGLVIIGSAWRQIHRARGELVTSRLYSRMRHPQYSGLSLFTLGFIIQWPTFVTLAMWPVLMFMYYRLARREEMEMENLFGDKYVTYRQHVPMFFPRRTTAPKANTRILISG